MVGMMEWRETRGGDSVRRSLREMQTLARYGGTIVLYVAGRGCPLDCLVHGIGAGSSYNTGQQHKGITQVSDIAVIKE